MNLESEELNMEKIPEWIYAPTNFSPELEKTFEAVEKALGFKLFIWQKTFIANTTYRRSGRTTAEILREFLTVFEQSDRLRIVKNEKDVYTGFLALMEHAGDMEALMDAEVKRFRPTPEIRHKEWRKRGLMAPLQPQETPEYSFSDLQMNLYNTIYL